MTILGGDIGGTKTHLALFPEGNFREKLFQKKYASHDHKDLLSIIRDFLSSSPLKGEAPHKAGFGVAGPVIDGKCKATNLPWIIDAQQIATEFSIPHIALLNDLEANAYGIPQLHEDEIFILNEGHAETGNRALISAGTGLGEAGIIWDGTRHIPFACEGGHADFAPRDELEMELLRYLKEKYDHTSYERVISGPGIYNIYRFLADMRLEEEDPEIRRTFTVKDPPHVITELALEESDPLAERAVNWFLSLYGAEAGNTALKFLSINGLYLGGGLAPLLLPLLEKSNFMASFINKGRFSTLLQNIPVRVILNSECTLMGAGSYIANKS